MTTLQGLLQHVQNAARGTQTPSMPVKGSITTPLNPMVEDQGISITSIWLGDAETIKFPVLNMRMCKFTVSTGSQLLW